MSHILRLCTRWDELSRGESSTTRQVREAHAKDIRDVIGLFDVHVGMGRPITLRRYLYWQAMIATPLAPSEETREVVDTLQAELEAMGWDRNDRKTWEQWCALDMLGE